MKGSVIMAMKNDERVLLLKKQIDEKRSGLAAQKFSPKTNCIIDLDGQKYNINVLQVNELELLLVKLSVYSEFAKNLGFELVISGYLINEWITDIDQKLAVIKVHPQGDIFQIALQISRCIGHHQTVSRPGHGHIQNSQFL